MTTITDLPPLFRLFLVGGAIRDAFRGIRSKDKDFTVVAGSIAALLSVEEAFDGMLGWLTTEHGVEFFKLDADTVTARGRFAKDHPDFPGWAADFVLARKDGPSSDGRHPDFVEVGDLFDDLARRDFTVNAIAQDDNGVIIDPHDGLADLDRGLLRFVGEPMDRIRQDALRVMRAMRFTVCKGFKMHSATWAAICDPEVPGLLGVLPDERRRDELALMFDHDTLATLALIAELPRPLTEAMFAGRVRLMATMKD